MEATARDMRYKTHSLFDLLSRGDSVVITYRGRKAAILSPYKDGGAPYRIHVKNHPFFGSAPSAGESVTDIIDRLRGGRFDDI